MADTVVSSLPLPLGSVVGGRYRLEGVLGQGGMATVYQATDTVLARPVALKLLTTPSPSPEAQLSAALSHPHLVHCYDAGQTATGQPFLVLELVAGPPLSRLVPLPPASALRLASQVASALVALHAAGIVHGDLTPANVLRTPAGQAKLSDLGVARGAGGATATPVVYGAAPYLAPERLAGGPLTPACDAYALGALLVALLTGQPPYGTGPVAAVRARAVAGRPVGLAGRVVGLPGGVDGLLAGLLAPDPVQRLAVTPALVEQLARLADQAARQAESSRPWRSLLTWPAVRALATLAWVAARRQARATARALTTFARAARTDARARLRLAALMLVLLAVVGLSVVVVQRRAVDRFGTATRLGLPRAAAQGVLPTATAPSAAAIPTPTAPPATGPIRVEAAISDPNPPRSARMTVSARLLRGAVPIAGARLRSVWHFRSGDATCHGGVSGTDGRASCTLGMAGATAGYPVKVDVIFEYEGQTYTAEVTFTPQP